MPVLNLPSPNDSYKAISLFITSSKGLIKIEETLILHENKK